MKIINIVLNYFGIILFGYIACAYTTFVSYVLFAFGHYIFLQKTLRQNNINENVVSLRDLVLISGLFVAMSLTITALYSNWILRYSLCGVLILLSLMNRKKIVLLLKEIKNK